VHLLLVEDDDAIAEPLVRGLAREQLTTTRVSTGGEALSVFEAEQPELVLLDLGLPDMDGYEVCRALRADSDVPIIMLTARGDEIDRVLGLELGADDYLVKPFGFRELLARIHAVTRRTGARRGPEAEPEVLRHGAVELDLRTHRATAADGPLTLTRKEFDLLAMLLADPEATCTREAILGQVWDPHWYGPTKTLDVHVASLRKKLGDPGFIETIRGVGFRLRAGG
jgi:DNA-binding response OmpR family regulator